MLQPPTIARRTTCLKYLVLANMLMKSGINPFDSQEAKPYKNNPEILAMTNLVRCVYDVCHTNINFCIVFYRIWSYSALLMFFSNYIVFYLVLFYCMYSILFYVLYMIIFFFIVFHCIMTRVACSISIHATAVHTRTTTSTTLSAFWSRTTRTSCTTLSFANTSKVPLPLFTLTSFPVRQWYWNSSDSTPPITFVFVLHRLVSLVFSKRQWKLYLEVLNKFSWQKLHHEKHVTQCF